MNQTDIDHEDLCENAVYIESEVDRFRGNPFIEALPELPKSKAEFKNLLRNSPPIPTDKTRSKSEVARFMELPTILDTVVAFPAYKDAALTLSSLIPEAYVSRNPLTVGDVRRRHAIMAASRTGAIALPAGWRTSSKGALLTSISGMGKTTLALSFLSRYPQMIRHEEYGGKQFRKVQLVWLYLRCSHDGSLKGLCMQFFEAIDDLFKTNYQKEARSVKSVAQMTNLMKRVCTSVSLGLLVVDEVQNLRNAKGPVAEQVLNVFSEIIEGLGISVLAIATPALSKVLERSVRNTRKMISFGSIPIEPMKRGSSLWTYFSTTMWKYMYTKNKVPLSSALSEIWFDVSGGNTAFATLAFMLVQRRAIGTTETINTYDFEAVANHEMAFLKPAIAALRSGTPADLARFDDLIDSAGLENLWRTAVGAPDTDEHENNNGANQEEFPEKEFDKPAVRGSKADKGSTAAGESSSKDVRGGILLPTEDAFPARR